MALAPDICASVGTEANGDVWMGRYYNNSVPYLPMGRVGILAGPMSFQHEVLSQIDTLAE